MWACDSAPRAATARVAEPWLKAALPIARRRAPGVQLRQAAQEGARRSQAGAQARSDRRPRSAAKRAPPTAVGASRQGPARQSGVAHHAGLFAARLSLTNRCGQGEHTRHEVQALVNGGEAKAGTSWKDWPELEQDERIGVGLADKPKSADGRADGSGRAPKVYHYERKVKPQRAETLARLVEQVVKALRDNPVRRTAQASPPDSAD